MSRGGVPCILVVAAWAPLCLAGASPAADADLALARASAGFTAEAGREPTETLSGTALTGRSITLVPGHGYYWNGSGWNMQRPVYCAPLNTEDEHNLEMCQYLEAYLIGDGMLVKSARCTNKLYGNHPLGFAWWRMSSYVWLEHMGYPCWVWNSYSGDCTIGTGTGELGDDIRAGAYASNYDGTDLLIALHTNGARGDCTGDCPTGTEVYYSTQGGHAPWGEDSLRLAQVVFANFLDTITSHADPTWGCHGECLRDSTGPDVYLANRPAMMIEIGFHDTCDRDADELHLRDNYFRSAAMWGIYKGVCEYFETEPTWPFYWAEYVTDTIPEAMNGGQTYEVSITLRNRSVAWTAARGFRLGAVGDSDPLASSIRYSPSIDVGPGQTMTFRLWMTPPWEGGSFVTDWQMIHEGVTWFGEIVSREVVVVPFSRADFDRDGDVDQADFGHLQSCLTGNMVAQNVPQCTNARLDGDSDVDQVDALLLIGCLTGPDQPADPLCTE